MSRLPDNAAFYTSDDGLQLYYRDFGSANAGTPVICLPGLTRNSRDFEDLALRLAAHRRVLTPDFRGRGYSQADPEWSNYHPGSYVADVCTLLDSLGIDRVVIIGTSLGGLCAMMMAAMHPGRVAGIVLNDIGPEINPAGLARVQQYTGRVPEVANWDEAVAQSREIYGEWLPGLSDEDWKKMAWRAYRSDEHGVPRLDIDNNIGVAVRKVGAQKGDMWLLYEALAGVPTVLLWGTMSDILTRDIVEKMQQRKADLVVVPVPNRGHVPLLDEPECTAAVDRLLEQIP